MFLLYVYVIRQGPNQYPSCALTWIRTSLVQCTPEAEKEKLGRLDAFQVWMANNTRGVPSDNALIFLDILEDV
jgi:hypothetical protein